MTARAQLRRYRAFAAAIARTLLILASLGAFGRAPAIPRAFAAAPAVTSADATIDVARATRPRLDDRAARGGDRLRAAEPLLALAPPPVPSIGPSGYARLPARRDVVLGNAPAVVRLERARGPPSAT